MPLAVQPPVTVVERTDAWLAAPALAARSTAWLEIPRGMGGPDVVVRRGGDALGVRGGGRARIVFAGGCAAVAGDDCDAVRAPAPAGDVAFAYAVSPGASATYVASVDAAAGKTTVVHANEQPGADRRMLVAASDVAVAWTEGGAIFLRNSATGAVRRVVARKGAGGTVTSLATVGNRVLWSARRPNGTTSVRIRIGGRAPATLVTEKGVRAVGGVAFGGDGTAALARRVVRRGRARIEIVLVPAGGGPRVVARSAPFGGGARAHLPRLSAAGNLLAFRLRSGARGRTEAIWVAHLGGGGARRVVRVDRRRARLSDPGVSPGRVVWARSDLAANGRTLVRSQVRSAGVRLR